MKAKNAKVGLRVQMKSEGNYVPVGSVGTIAHVLGAQVWVHWDDDVEGWGTSEYNIPSGHGWTVSIKDLRKVQE